jgi:hypothetical protein
LVDAGSQYASAFGKNAVGETLISVTLLPSVAPAGAGLRPFLPVRWTSDFSTLDRAGV